MEENDLQDYNKWLTNKEKNEYDFIDVIKPLRLDGFIINPRDNIDDFEIEIEAGFNGDAYAYLNKEQAIKLAIYILKSFKHNEF